MNKKNNNREWELESTTRHKRENMERAMRGRIERGLVELITNSVDSYKNIIDNNKHIKCKIGIEIQRCKGNKESLIIVRDRACGMSREEMKRKLGILGGRTSGFESGKTRRGFHGKGAKDVAAFGKVEFESIQDNYYNNLEIKYSLICSFKNSKPIKANKSIREKLGLKRNGTVVTMHVKSRFAIPQHETLLRNFSRYYSLRDIFSENRFEISLIDINNKRIDQLIYKFPDGEILFNEKIEIPKYPEANANLTLKLHNEAFDQNLNNEYKEGILIKSPSAIHQCTHFQLESDPIAYKFTGELNCDYIDTLVREYDDLEQMNPENPLIKKENPIRLLNSDRDGLILEHPFAQSLFKVGKSILLQFVEGIRNKERVNERDVTNGNLENKLEKLSKEISKIFLKKINEMDEDLILNEPIPNVNDYNVGLHIIPPGEQTLFVNEPKTFSIIIKNYEELDDSIPIEVISSNPDIMCIKKSPVFINKFSDDKKMGGSTFTVFSNKIGQESFVEVRYNGFDNLILLKVIKHPEIDIPDNLSFEKSKYIIPFNKTKNITIRLKTNKKMDNYINLNVVSTNPDIVVKNGGLVSLKITKIPYVYQGQCNVQGRKLHAKGELIASHDNLNDVSTKLIVKEKDNKKAGMNFKFIPVEENFGSLRYMWDTNDRYKLLIGAMHPSIRPYLGIPIDNKYPGINTKEYHIVLAEIISEALAFDILEKKFKSEGVDSRLDFASADLYYHKESSDFLQIAHKYLVT